MILVLAAAVLVTAACGTLAVRQTTINHRAQAHTPELAPAGTNEGEQQ